MGHNDVPSSGMMLAEGFDCGPNHICTGPIRDVTIGQMTDGWFVTSYINFRARQYRRHWEHQATILNIDGRGNTLDEALAVFEHNFTHKRYNPPLDHRERGVQ
jgi:hypothetical protein